MKAFLRFLSFLFLVAAVFMGVLDSIRSVSTSSVNITGILSVWDYLLPASRTMVEAALRTIFTLKRGASLKMPCRHCPHSLFSSRCPCFAGWPVTGDTRR